MPTVPEVLERYEVPADMERFCRRFTTLEGLWRFCNRADWMLWMIENLRPCDANKLRIFTCHCARRWWKHLEDPRSQRAVEAAERFAAGQVTRSALDYIRDSAKRAAMEAQDRGHPNAARAAFIAVLALNDDALAAAKAASRLSSAAEHAINGTNSSEHEMEILSGQADDLRQLLGNPFAEPKPAAPLPVLA